MLASTKTWTMAFALAACGVALAGCSGDEFGRTLGFVRDAPDEFTVTIRAPLAMPPAFNLPPPTPGVPRPQEQSERAKAEQALVPQMALGAAAEGNSPGQQALLQAAGPPPTPGIRAEVDQDAKLNRPSEGVVDKLMFWRKPTPPGIVVDPQKEAQRLRENSALGQSPEAGDTPIVQPKKRAWLEGLF
jgi:hypothetical protein